MKKIIYLFKRILKLDYKNMFKTAREISKESKKNFIVIFFDIVICGFKYQAGYVDYKKYEFHILSKAERKTFLTRGKNNHIIKTFNDKKHFYKLESKIEFNKTYEKFLKRNWLQLDGENLEEFIQFMKENKKVIVKPLDLDNGRGIKKLEYKQDENYEEVYKDLIENNQVLIEELLVQHEELNKICPTSVNTMRMFTLYKDGKAHLMQSALKLGNGHVADNLALGGMFTCLDDDGIAYAPAINYKGEEFEKHPMTNEKILGLKVPLFKEAENLVKEAAKVVPEIAYVGWDVAITQDGPCIIEGNPFPEILQTKPSLMKKREGLIPKYNKIMGIF